MSDLIEVLQEHVDLLKKIKDAPPVPKKVTDTDTILLLIDSGNWNINNDYINTDIDNQNAGDWYKDETYFYIFDTPKRPIRLVKTQSGVFPSNVLINE